MTSRNQVRMPVVITVLDESRAKSWYPAKDEFADQTRKVRGHHEGFQSIEISSGELAVDETDEVNPLRHRSLNVFNLESVWQYRPRIESRHINRGRYTSFFFEV